MARWRSTERPRDPHTAPLSCSNLINVNIRFKEMTFQAQTRVHLLQSFLLCSGVTCTCPETAHSPLRVGTVSLRVACRFRDGENSPRTPEEEEGCWGCWDDAIGSGFSAWRWRDASGSPPLGSGMLVAWNGSKVSPARCKKGREGRREGVRVRDYRSMRGAGKRD